MMTPTERDAIQAILVDLKILPNHPVMQRVERILAILVKRPSKRALHEKATLRDFGDESLPNAHGPIWTKGMLK